MDECDPRLGEGLCRAVCNVSRQVQLNPPPSLTERCKNGILILPKAKATQKYAQFKRSRSTYDTIFAPTRQGRSAPPTAVAGAAASALQSKNIRSLPINCPFYRKFLTEPGIFSPPPTPPYVPFGIRRFSFLSHTVSTLLLFII